MANEEHLKILKQGVDAWNQWRENNLNNPDLSGANLSGANLNKGNLIKANLRVANLYRADLIRADLIGAKLSGAKLNWAKLSGANLHWADLNGADLNGADLNGANLAEADLSGANLSAANLGGADLSRVDLGRADLSGADLSGANLSGAELIVANLRGVNLSRANLSGANLTRADLRRAKLSKAIFNKVVVDSTIFADVNLSDANGLETLMHYGPSSIGIDTIYRSQGKIPETFLRGAGVPENFIEYMHSLFGKAIQFYSCFISYSTKDQEFAERLHSDLQAEGVRVWFTPEDIKGGHKLYEQIPEAIRLYDKLLLVLSENSMKSEWVKTEIIHARQSEIRENRRKLFVIRLVDFNTIKAWETFDVVTRKDIAREVREYFILDFSNWKNRDEYKKAFYRLLRDLQAEK